MDERTTRRAVLAAGTATAGVALTGCQTYERGGGAKPPAAASAGTALGPAADIPVGGGKIYADKGVVVTQPVAGTFKAFTAICTHQGCTVAEVSNGTINCNCHGSRFKVADGSVANGPAPAPLAAKSVNVTGDQITLG